MYAIRKITDGDYEMLTGWWKWFRFPAPPKELLPDDGKGGIIIGKDGIAIAAGFIYFTNSRIAWIEYIVSNYEYREKDRAEALQALISELSAVAKSKGYIAAFTTVKNQSLIKHYEACGYVTGSTGSTEMVKAL